MVSRSRLARSGSGKREPSRLYKVKKAWNSYLWFVIEEDNEGHERTVGSFEELKDAKRRALERKEIMGDKRNVTIEKVLYYAGR